MQNYKSWFEKNKTALFQGGNWLRGQEINALPLDEWSTRDFKCLFVRLSTYYDTGYSFTHQLLYQLAASVPGVYPDLAYLPPRADLRLFEKDQIPWLLGTQSKQSGEKFDLIGFSNSIVQELINLPSFLAKSGIPLSKKERMTRQDLPILLMGGANALYSSSIWGTGDNALVDVIFVGESDAAIKKIIEICKFGKDQKKTKAEILDLLEEVPGVFQPDKPRTTRKSFIPNLNQSEALEKGPVYYLEDQLGSSHLQISEGCPCFCSFCAESWDRKPYRERGSKTLVESALRAKAAMGLDKIDLYSFNFNMHSGFYDILWELVPYFRSIGLKSQRFDLLAQDPQMIEFQHAIEKASLTCGLEGISPRLRKYLHKNLESDQLHKSLEAILKSKARELKMFLIATGLEEEQDFTALADFVEHLSRIKRNLNASTRIIFSMTPLVRFPWTPLEFEKAYSREHYQKIIAKVSKVIQSLGFEFRESADLPEYWTSQVLVRADSPLITEALLESVKETGYVYYRDIPETYRKVLEEKLAHKGLKENELFSEITLEQSRLKPWAQIETGVKRDFLWEEVQRARQYKEIDYCLGRSWREAKCFHCGGCPTRFHVRDIVLATQKRSYNLEQFKKRIADARQSERTVYFLFKTSKAALGVPRRMLGVALARALMKTDPELAKHYRGFGGAFWQDEEKPVWVSGYDRVALIWNQSALQRLSALLENPLAKAQIQKYLSEGEGWGELVEIQSEENLWKPSMLELESSFEPKPEQYLKAHGLKFTFKKDSSQPEANLYEYELSRDSIKKGYVQKLWLQKPGRVRVIPGPKFDRLDFLKNAFSSVSFSEQSRVEMRVLS